jgi:hypothetical protein
VDVYVFRASFSAFFCKTLQRYTTKLLKPVSGAEKKQFFCFFLPDSRYTPLPRSKLDASWDIYTILLT